MNHSKCILILTADVGFGHRAAANAVAEALQELHGRECTIDIVNPMEDERAPALLRDSSADYDGVVRGSQDFHRLGYQVTDAPLPAAIMEGVITLMLFDVMRDIVDRYKPDAILAPYLFYQAPLGAVFARNKVCVPLITVVTDLANVHRLWFNDTADLCLVPTREAHDQAVINGLSPAKLQVTGIPVRPRLARREHAPEAARARLGWRTDLTTALVVGSKRVGNLADVLHVLNHSGLPLQLVVVAGGDDQLYQALQNTKWHATTHLYNFVDDMPAFMHASDFTISKAGGLVVSESLACGLPLLLIDVIPGQETGNAEYVTGKGAAELASSPVEALEILCHWLDHDGALLAQRASQARQLGRPRAAYEVAERVWQAAQVGPQPRPQRRLLPKLGELLGIEEESGPGRSPAKT